MAAAIASATSAAVAAGAAASSELRPRSAVVAVAAASGGLAGFLLWRWATGTCNPVDRAISRIEAVHRKQPRRPQDALDEAEYCQEVERWVIRLRGGADLVSPALRLAACAQHLERHALARNTFPDGREGYLKWRAAVKRNQAQRLQALLRTAGIEDAIVQRASRLVGKELPLSTDSEMQSLEDAACLVFLQFEMDEFQKDKPDLKLTDIFQKTWKKMSRQAQTFALGLDYTPRVLGCLVEAIAAAEGLTASVPLVAPRLPPATVALLRESWSVVPKESFGKEFFERLYAEEPSMSAVFNFPIARPENISKVVQLLLDLLDVDSVPRLERVTHAVAALSHHFGSVRMVHMAPLKRALVRSVTAHAPPKEKKTCNRVWEAFFYALAAVAAPHLVMRDRLDEFAASTAATLPTPGGGPHAGAIAAHGAALLEMSLGITALTPGSGASSVEVVNKLREARGWLLDAVRDDVNAYCGLLSSVYAKPLQDDVPGTDSAGLSIAEAERRRWLRRAAEVPLRVAEVAMGAAIACLPWRRQIKRSLQADWIAGAKMLRTGAEISVRNATFNVRDMQRGAPEIEKRLAQLRDTEPPWEDLCDI